MEYGWFTITILKYELTIPYNMFKFSTVPLITEHHITQHVLLSWINRFLFLETWAPDAFGSLCLTFDTPLFILMFVHFSILSCMSAFKIEYTELKIINFRVGIEYTELKIISFGVGRFGCYLLTFVGSWLINVKEWKLKWSVKILNISELIKDAVNWYTDREISRNLVCWEATQFAFCQLHGRSSAWKFQDTNLTGLQNAEPPVFKSTTLFPLISNIVKMCQGQVSFLKKCLS